MRVASFWARSGDYKIVAKCRVAGNNFPQCQHFEGGIQPCASAQQSETQCPPETIQHEVANVAGLCGFCTSVAQPTQGPAEISQQPVQGGASVAASTQLPGSDVGSRARSEVHRPGRQQYVQQEDGSQREDDASTVINSDPGSRDPSQDRRRDAELLEAQTAAALAKSRREAEVQDDDELEKALEISRHSQHLYESQLLDRTVNLSLQDTEREYDARAQQDLQRALRESTREFQRRYNEDEAIHRAKLESLRSLSQDMSRRQPRNRQLVESRSVRQTASAVAGPSNASNVSGHSQANFFDQENDDESESEAATVRSSSPRTAVRERWGQVNRHQVHSHIASPGPQSVVSSARSAQTNNRLHGTPEPTQDSQRGALGPFEWARPSAQLRSPSPPITIRTADAQRAHEEWRRNALFDQRPEGSHAAQARRGNDGALLEEQGSDLEDEENQETSLVSTRRR
ncbi:hypothetical protein LTR37_001079 [Vermiconidia calcicola]|uniref:Uncharacterized protein n=1 Tax=Vermiconidia calcicola TaxID=1690605 RepID=A0ACC3NXK3_9PEZI|nr:hypothetical protein LTR37_001079 [Vermiconidia calcicola]